MFLFLNQYYTTIVAATAVSVTGWLMFLAGFGIHYSHSNKM